MNDLEEGLLVGKGKKQAKEYKRRFDEVQIKVKTLKNKNNELQKQCDSELETEIKRVIKLQGEYLEKETNELKTLMSKLSADFTDPGSKNKIKELWKQAGAEIERNKRIMAEFVNRASSSPSFMRRSTYRAKARAEGNGPKRQDSEYSNGDIISNARSVVEDEEVLEDDVALQQRIMAERNAILKEIEQKNYKINQLFNDMGDLVGGEQHDMVNQIDANVSLAKQNMGQANYELDQAQIEQKKAKKKYLCLATIIIILILAGAGIIYLFLR